MVTIPCFILPNSFCIGYKEAGNPLAHIFEHKGCYPFLKLLHPQADALGDLEIKSRVFHHQPFKVVLFHRAKSEHRPMPGQSRFVEIRLPTVTALQKSPPVRVLQELLPSLPRSSRRLFTCPLLRRKMEWEGSSGK